MKNSSFLSLSGKRKKVDLQFIENLNRSGITLHMKRDCFVTKSDCDMRRSLAWDSAFFTSPGVLDADEMFETLNFRVADNGVDITGEREMRPLPSQSVRPEQMSGTAECGVRKSLAWDSAFFTNAGIIHMLNSVRHMALRKQDPQILRWRKSQQELVSSLPKIQGTANHRVSECHHQS